MWKEDVQKQEVSKKAPKKCELTRLKELFDMYGDHLFERREFEEAAIGLCCRTTVITKG